jgi:hypothetical protein
MSVPLSLVRSLSAVSNSSFIEKTERKIIDVADEINCQLSIIIVISFSFDLTLRAYRIRERRRRRRRSFSFSRCVKLLLLRKDEESSEWYAAWVCVGGETTTTMMTKKKKKEKGRWRCLGGGGGDGGSRGKRVKSSFCSLFFLRLLLHRLMTMNGKRTNASKQERRKEGCFAVFSLSLFLLHRRTRAPRALIEVAKRETHRLWMEEERERLCAVRTLMLTCPCLVCIEEERTIKERIQFFFTRENTCRIYFPHCLSSSIKSSD